MHEPAGRHGVRCPGQPAPGIGLPVAAVRNHRPVPRDACKPAPAKAQGDHPRERPAPRAWSQGYRTAGHRRRLRHGYVTTTIAGNATADSKCPQRLARAIHTSLVGVITEPDVTTGIPEPARGRRIRRRSRHQPIPDSFGQQRCSRRTCGPEVVGGGIQQDVDGFEQCAQGVVVTRVESERGNDPATTGPKHNVKCLE